MNLSVCQRRMTFISSTRFQFTGMAFFNHVLSVWQKVKKIKEIRTTPDILAFVYILTAGPKWQKFIFREKTGL